MSRVVGIGEGVLLDGYALAGVEVVDAADPAGARRAWDELPADVELVLLSPAAQAALASRLAQRSALQRSVLWVVVST